MNKTILLAVDAQHYAPEATELVRELSQDAGGKVVVLHVHEFATGRFGRIQVDCLEGAAERLLPDIISELQAAGVTADSEIREAHVGHIARTILKAADQHGAQVIVIGAAGHTDLPHVPLGGVSHRLLHLARRPVLIVPRRAPAQAAPADAASETAQPVTG
jgi:nucleotide-binding universal stress UspA family protein